jgi:hypothetical protein
MTTSNSPPPVATLAVIFARASFSDSETKRIRMPGFSASNCGASLIASSICGFETIATVTVCTPASAPSAPAPEHPATVPSNATPSSASAYRARPNRRGDPAPSGALRRTPPPEMEPETPVDE